MSFLDTIRPHTVRNGVGLTILLFSLFQFSYGQGNNCRENENGTICYSLSDEPFDWKNASLFCENQGGNLAEIFDQGTQDFIETSEFLSEIDPGVIDKYWIGGQLKELDGWMWEDDTYLVNYTNNDNGTWPRWAPGHPRDDIDGLFYVFMSAADDFYWINDNGLFSNIRVICQHEPPCDVDEEFDGACFQIVSQSHTVFNARQVCEESNGHLATVNSPKVFDHLQEKLRLLDGTDINGYWIGLHLAEWRWSDDTSIIFSNWGPSEPADGNALAIQLICGAECDFLWFANGQGTTHRAMCEWKFLPTTEATTVTPDLETTPGQTPTNVNISTELLTQEPYTGTTVTQKPFTGTTITQEPFTGTTITQEPFTGTTITQEPFTGTTVSQEPFTGTTISQEPFTGTTITKEPFTGTTITQEPFTGTTATQKPFTGTTITQEPFTGTTVSQEPFTGTTVTQEPFTGTTITQEPFTGTTVSQEPYTGTPITQEPFPGTTITQEPFTGTTFTQEPFTGTTFTQEPFTGTTITQEPFTGTPDTQKTYTGTTIRHEPFTGTTITQEPFTGTTITQEPYTGTTITQEPFTGTTITKEPFTGTTITKEPFTGTTVLTGSTKLVTTYITDHPTGTSKEQTGVTTKLVTGTTDPTESITGTAEPGTTAVVETVGTTAEPGTGTGATTEPGTGTGTTTEPGTGTGTTTEPGTGTGTTTEPGTGTGATTEPGTGTGTSATPYTGTTETGTASGTADPGTESTTEPQTYTTTTSGELTTDSTDTTVEPETGTADPETGTITTTTGDPDNTPGTGTITTTTGDKTPGTGTTTSTTGDPDQTPGTVTPPGTGEPGPPTGTTTEDVGGTAAPVTALGAWAIVGIAAAVVLLLIIVIVLLCVALKRTSGPDARGVYYTDFDDVHAEGSFREGESKPEGGAVEYTNPVFEQNNIVQTNGHVPVGDTTSATDVDALYAKPIKRGASKPSFYTVDGKLRGDGVYGEVVGDVDIERTSVTSASPPVSKNRQQDSVSIIPSESSFAGYTPGQNRESGFPTIDEDSIIDSSQFVTTIILR